VTIRSRLSLWYVSVSLVALTVIGVGLYLELVVEREQDTARYGHADSVAQEIGDILLCYTLPAIGIMVVGGWWLTRRALAPLAALTDAAERISVHNLSERLPTPGSRDELDRLTEVFNQMLARLDESVAQIRDFTLNASHELKTPLTILQGEFETALRDESCTPALRDFLASQLDEIQRLTKVTEGLTLLANADAGQIVLARESVRLHELVRDSFADAQMLAQSRRITVELTRCDEVSLCGDRHRLRQLLLNLVDNAVKYNVPDGRVTIGLARHGAVAEVAIANTGPGISREQQPRVFDRFYRGATARNFCVEGCGLGLSIARWIVQAHGGAIGIASTPGQMTAVTVSLPIGAANTSTRNHPSISSTSKLVSIS
jgi:heavy metal sensor kinase